MRHRAALFAEAAGRRFYLPIKQRGIRIWELLQHLFWGRSMEVEIPRFFPTRRIVETGQWRQYCYRMPGGEYAAVVFSTRERAETFKRAVEQQNDWTILFIGYEKLATFLEGLIHGGFKLLCVDVESPAVSAGRPVAIAEDFLVCPLKTVVDILRSTEDTGDPIKANFSKYGTHLLPGCGVFLADMEYGELSNYGPDGGPPIREQDADRDPKRSQ